MVIVITPRRLRDSPMTAHVVNRSAAERTLSRQFAEQERREPSSARAAAFARFAAAGLPTRRVEAWHYTDLRASMADAAPIWPAPTRADIEAARSRARRARAFRCRACKSSCWAGDSSPTLSDSLPTNVFIAEGVVAQFGRRSIGRAQRGAKSHWVYHLDPRGAEILRANHGAAPQRRGVVLLRLFPNGYRVRGGGAERRSLRYSKALMPGSSDTRRRS